MLHANSFSIILALLASSLVQGLAKLEPADGKLIFGAWFDSSTGPVSGGETAASFNKKIGFNSGVFQVYQHLPPRLPKDGPPDYDTKNHNADGTINLDILNEGTDAAIFLTIYPDNSTGIADSDINALAIQCRTIINTTGRNLFIRFGPEMNGDWMSYSGNPTAYIALWRKVYTAVNNVAPSVAFVWSPNPDTYQGIYPYAPYWPGPDYVDWVGLSTYWKGFQDNYPYSYMKNSLCPTDYTAQVLDAKGQQGSKVSFYQEYVLKYDKPFVISEGGGAFQLAYSEGSNRTLVDPGPGRTQMVMGFWNSNIFNPDFMNAYPKVKMAISFEIWKLEAEQQFATERDFRIIGDDATASTFRTAIMKLDDAGHMIWAKVVPAKTSATTAAEQTTAAVTTTTSALATSALVVTQNPSNKDAVTQKTSYSPAKTSISLTLLLSILIIALMLF
ncbi:glycoside hydrolase [Rhizoclosmatium globosum]|uniref:Glycoside hydrolase n=1 Tax=Rhizoclosmatium globosum TaxID=329046 RepID=A0A1Y2BS86_9FUNG|nr:glycoside hydrolase [Rhizoclosmatium globosum]|eukprot:ORY37611.1 glycoside hydrolase [Rhizoclosmatium globosum]